MSTLVADVTIWRGNQAEGWELQSAVGRNCACQKDAMGVVVTRCAPHAMLLNQRTLDHILFVKRQLAARIVAEEWTGIYEPGEG